MAKAVKKKGKSRKLKRSIRKTLGALFLASALAGKVAVRGDSAHELMSINTR